MTISHYPMQRALISVSDKTGLLPLAKTLHKCGIQILSTGGTAEQLSSANIPVTEVSTHTEFPEIMAGRVKTLHPKIHGGILGRRGQDEAVMAEHNISAIDLVVVNLYPFAKTVANPHCSLEQAIENIDIGGPAMVRAAAKNHHAVTVVTDPADYPTLIDQIEKTGGTDPNTRFHLAIKAFAHTAQYDGAISNYLSALQPDMTHADFPQILSLQYHKAQDLRYGENPHQKAAFYIESGATEPSVASAEQLQGKALSYNNIADSDAALECVKQFDRTACVIVKHANPCGVALGETVLSAYEGAYRTDPTSAFGGIIAFNRPLEADVARIIIERQFVEVIIAPSVTSEAQTILQTKTNIRILACGMWHTPIPSWDYQRVVNSLLVQERDLPTIGSDGLQFVSQRKPSATELQDLLFAWQVAKFVKSNAIVYAKKAQTIGIGAGQMSRVYSAKIAGIKAQDEGLDVANSVMASDAFFPFRDGIDSAAAVGISAVIQPGGSLRDQEVIAAANEHDMAMVFTGMRHFRH